MPIYSRLLPQISLSSTQLFLQLHSISTLCATMASRSQPRVDLGGKTVKDLIEDCLSIFPDCTQILHMERQLYMGNMMESLRIWAQRTEEAVAESGSVDKVLESRPNALYHMKLTLFIIFDKLNWYKTNARDDEETAKCMFLIKYCIDALDIVGNAVIG